MIRSQFLNGIKKVELFNEKHPVVFPVSLFALALATYGIFIFSLGFYWDDWPPLLLSHIADKSAILEYFSYDRPFQSWTYYVLLPICRDSTFLWQLSVIIFRWTTALTLYFTFLRIFPKQRFLLQWAAALFIVFPGFSSQYASVSFGSHFITYTVFGLSIFTMVLAIQNKNRFWLFFTLSLIFTGIHLFTMEYFVGLEVLRPILIFILLSRTDSKKSKILLQTFLHYLPYFIVFGFFVYWRMVLYPAAIGGNLENNYPFLISEFLKAPINTILLFGQTVFSDLRFLLISIWTDRLIPNEIPGEKISFGFSIAFGLIASVLFYFFFIKNKNAETFRLNAKETSVNFAIAFSIIVFGLLPVWSTLRKITDGKWTDRFDLPAIFGVVLLITTLLFVVIQNPKIRNAFFILIVGLSIGYHIRIGNEYRKDFLRQQAFYLQLKWRIPKLEPGTTLYSPTIPTSKEADYSYSMGINLLYEDAQFDTSFDYWLSGPRYFKPQVLIKNPTLAIEHALRVYTFIGSASKIVSIHLPDTGCLWVIDPYYALTSVGIENFPLYGSLTKQTLIIDEAMESNEMSAIFDFGPQKTWCYFFEKGDLAQSKGNWDEAINYYEQAMVEKLVPVEGIEYLPFIKAYAKSGRIEDAVGITKKAFAKTSLTKPALCQFWQDALDENPTISTSRIEAVYNLDNCPSFFTNTK